MKRIIISFVLAFVFTAFAIHAVEQKAFVGAGIIESTSGGFEFPDGTVQLTAANLPCTAITYLPYIITQQGIYCLTGNLATSMTSGNAIEIQSDDVVLDLNGWKLGGRAAGLGTSAFGIFAFERRNITIRNGVIVGFLHGITLADTSSPPSTSKNHLVENIRAIDNRHNGIWVSGNDSIVQNNDVLNTGDSTHSGLAYGIVIDGKGARVIGNDVIGVEAYSTEDAVGIHLFNTHNAIIEENRVTFLNVSGSGSGMGIYSYLGEYVLIINNRITNADNGIKIIDGGGGKYGDNLTNNVTTPFFGGTDIGGNN